MKIIKTTYILTLPLLFCGVVHAASDINVYVDGTLGLDDNVKRANNDLDIEHDIFATVGGLYAHELYQGQNSRLEGKVDLTFSQFSEFSGLSNYTAGGSLVYTFGFSGAFGAPWYSIDLGYTFSEFKSFLRDSDTYKLGFTVGKRWDDRTDFKVGLTYKKRDSDGLVFDTDNISIFMNIDWSIKENTILYTTLRVQQGDIVSTADPNNISIYVVNEATAIESDDVFTNDLSYRIDATVLLLTVGLNLARSEVSAWDASLRFLSATTDSGFGYEDLTIKASYLHRFSF